MKIIFLNKHSSESIRGFITECLLSTSLLGINRFQMDRPTSDETALCVINVKVRIWSFNADLIHQAICWSKSNSTGFWNSVQFCLYRSVYHWHPLSCVNCELNSRAPEQYIKKSNCTDDTPSSQTNRDTLHILSRESVFLLKM